MGVEEYDFDDGGLEGEEVELDVRNSDGE